MRDKQIFTENPGGLLRVDCAISDHRRRSFFLLLLLLLFYYVFHFWRFKKNQHYNELRRGCRRLLLHIGEMNPNPSRMFVYGAEPTLVIILSLYRVSCTDRGQIMIDSILTNVSPDTVQD